MTWFTAQSVSVTNGQTIVSVVNATSDDIAIAQEAGGLVIGNNPPVEIKRTYLDGSNNKRIELRSPWPYATQSGQPAVAFPTDADLAEATRVLRAVGSDAVTFAEALAQVLSSTAATLTIQTETSGAVTVVPYGKLTADVQALLATMGDFGVPLYGTDTKNQARTLLGLQPQVTAQPTLNLDFANNEYRVYEPFGLTRKTLTEAILTTRASVASYNSPFGVASAAANTPRIEYDSVTGEALGLLCEEQRTNLLLWSEDFTRSVWSNRGDAVVSDTSILSPLGGTYASFQSGGDSANDLQQTITISGVVGDKISATWFLRQRNSAFIIVGIAPFPSGFNATARVDLSNGNIDQITSRVLRVSAEEMVGGGYKVTMTTEITQSTQSQAWIRAYPQNLGDFYIAAAQLEAGSFPTSYIKTEGSQVTRVSDLIKRVVGLDYSNITVYVNFSSLGLGVGSRVLEIQGATINNYVQFIQNGTSSELRVAVGIAAGVASIISIPGGFLSGGKVALCVRQGEFCAFRNGVKYANTLTTMPSGLLTSMGIGVRPDTNGNVFNGVFKEVAIFPRALSDQELIDLTRL